MPERRGFGLYVHWPFCQAKCPYCDFNSHVAASIDHEDWTGAYVSEIRRFADETGPRVLDTIFFGGGTPSLMQPATVERIIDTARAAWQPANEMEITLEANPTSVEAGKFRDFRVAGINRVSVGLQALNDADLKALGRLHTADEGRRAFGLASELFERASFDLIYARQDQSLRDWERELQDALSFSAGHLSLYQLTIEPDTAFGDRMARGRLRGLPDEDLATDMFFLTQDLTQGAGLPAYEVSNHAIPGAESRHNLIYWRSGDWVGIGPGAHGRLTLDEIRFATEAPKSPRGWLEAVAAGRGESDRAALTPEEVREERLLMGLRLGEGLPAEDVDISDDKLFYINSLSDSPLIERQDGHIRVTRDGRPLLNAILREVLA